MLTIHHLGVSQSERIVWLCEELDLKYELKRYERRADNRLAPEDYKALHPMGVAPVITDGAVALAESGAICDYINARYGQGRLAPAPSDPDFAEHLFWFHWTNATYGSAGFAGLALALAGKGPADVPLVKDRLERCRAMIEQHLGEAPFFGGRNLSLADIMMVWSLTTARTFRGGRIDDLPNTLSYLERIRQRPAYRRAMAKAEPGMAPMLT
jgi:glutathione S-transferase